MSIARNFKITKIFLVAVTGVFFLASCGESEKITVQQVTSPPTNSKRRVLTGFPGWPVCGGK